MTGREEAALNKGMRSCLMVCHRRGLWWGCSSHDKVAGDPQQSVRGPWEVLQRSLRTYKRELRIRKAQDGVAWVSGFGEVANLEKLCCSAEQEVAGHAMHHAWGKIQNRLTQLIGMLN